MADSAPFRGRSILYHFVLEQRAINYCQMDHPRATSGERPSDIVRTDEPMNGYWATEQDDDDVDYEKQISCDATYELKT